MRFEIAETQPSVTPHETPTETGEFGATTASYIVPKVSLILRSSGKALSAVKVS